MLMTQTQRDALTEIANIGAGKAAKQLSILLDDTVSMSVPKVLIGRPDDLEILLGMDLNESMVGIEQEAKGLLNAKITFLFYSNDSTSLAQELVGASLLEIKGMDMRSLQYDAITEIGNIVVASCVKSLSELLKGNIQLSLPTYAEGALNDMLKMGQGASPDSIVLVMQTQLEAKRRNVSGAMLLALSQTNLNELICSIDRWLDELMAHEG